MLNESMKARSLPTSPARALSILVGTLCWSVATNAQAWGDDGHRAVGELAWRLLSPQARAAVQESLTDEGYTSLAEAATWPDTYARRFPEYDPMKPFHYVNVDPTGAAFRRERDCPNGCVVVALAQFMVLLGGSDPPLSLAERRRTIYWVAHFMGDIHQPLHISHPDGKGGMSTLLWFFEAPDKRNAHWIWDSGLIERRPPLPAQLAEGVATDQPAYRALTDELLATLPQAKLAGWRRVISPEAIANEGLLLARRHAFLKATDRVDQAYETARWPIVAEQLQKAGVRLAAVLERALVE